MKKMNNSPTELILKIQELFEKNEYEHCLELCREWISQYPESSELQSYYYTLVQLASGNDISLSEIEEWLIHILRLQQYKNIHTIIDNIAFKYNVLDKKDKTLAELLGTWELVIYNILKEFYEIYFDFLNEKWEGEVIPKIKNDLIAHINQIPEKY